jgi:putative spermidine/putrescine transport system ATP-binding protein
VEVVNLADAPVKIGGQMVRTSQTLERAKGHAIRQAVRPEELNPGHRPDVNNLSGKVTMVAYLGSIVRVRVEVEGRPISIDMFNERRPAGPVIGESFEFSFHPDACWLL